MGDNDRSDSTNQADEPGANKQSDEQRAAALKSHVEKVQESTNAAPADDIIIK